MTASLIGAMIGLVAALVSVAFLRALAKRVELADTKRALRISGVVQLVTLPLAGWFVGSLFAGD